MRQAKFCLHVVRCVFFLKMPPHPPLQEKKRERKIVTSIIFPSYQHSYCRWVRANIDVDQDEPAMVCSNFLFILNLMQPSTLLVLTRLTACRLILSYSKVPKFRDARNLCCNLSKIQTKRTNFKGDCNPDDLYVLYEKKIYEQWILIPVSSKSVEKYRSYGRLNICKWTLMEAAIL